MKDYDIDDWELEIAFHWPHKRFAFGWEVIEPTEDFNYTTLKVYLLCITITLDS